MEPEIVKDASDTREEFDTLTLRFVGEETDGTAVHELRASHVAEVLQGVVGLSSDFAKAGVFGEGPIGSDVLVRPAQQGSFEIEVLRVIVENPAMVGMASAVVGLPTLSQVVWWASKSARASVSDYERLDNGNVKVFWQDNTVEEVPVAAWEELNKRRHRRKKQLRQIMAPLSDERVTSLEVREDPDDDTPKEAEPEAFTLTKPDYRAIQPDEEAVESDVVFETEASMSAIDFDKPTRWRVKTADGTRSVTVEDADFLGRVANGFPIRKSDIFRLKVRERTVVKDERSRSTWTVLKVESHRRTERDADT